jgi:leucyl aminopeptidase
VTDLGLTGTDVLRSKADVVVVGVTGGKGRKGGVDLRLTKGARPVDKALGGGLIATLTDLGFRAGEAEVMRVAALGGKGGPSSVIAVGLGDPAKVTPETLRRASGAATRAASGARRLATTLAVGGSADDLRAVCEGSLLGAYAFTRFRQASLDGQRAPVGSIVVAADAPKDKVSTAAAKRAEIVTDAVALVRDLVNTPPGDLFPATLGDFAEAECGKAGCEVTVYDEKFLKKNAFGGLLGVGGGSTHGPRLIRIAYRHPKAKRHIALVGKGVTFDSGGLSLKPAASMEWMKSDMSGAAAVIASLAAIARLKLPVNVTGWAPAAENMPSGTAIRPGDVLTMYGGKKVEVLNTDAEGRLILGDTLARAAEENPDVLIDVATLTGAQLVALGLRTAGVMSNDDDLRDHICSAAQRAGELAWPMPLPAELRKSIDSDVADITNTGDRYGGMLVGGVFLREFVPEGTPWAHIDIAGPAYNTADAWGYTPKGGTGFGVRTFVQLVEDWAVTR